MSVLNSVLGLHYQCQRAPAMRATNSKVQSLGDGDGMPKSQGWADALQGQCKGGTLLPSERSLPSRGTPAAVGALQLIPVPVHSHAASVSQVLLQLWGRKVLVLPFGLYLELFWCFITTRYLSPRCLSQRQTNNSPLGAFPVTLG